MQDSDQLVAFDYSVARGVFPTPVSFTDLLPQRDDNFFFGKFGFFLRNSIRLTLNRFN